MHWIVNCGSSRDGGYDTLVEQLERQGISHTLVRKPPLVPYLVAMHDDLDEHGHNRPLAFHHLEGPVFVTGITSMQAISLAHGWDPGYIDAPGLADCIAAWGDHMLNAGARFGTLSSIEPPDGGFFIRPDEGDKAFAGAVLDGDSFAEWRRNLITPGTHSYAPPETPVMIAPLRQILAEYRCVVVAGRYVTGSRYRLGRSLAHSAEVDDRIVRYVNERIAEWNPRRAIVVDIADTPDGLRVIETNAISSAGFYAIDLGLFVSEITRMGRGD